MELFCDGCCHSKDEAYFSILRHAKLTVKLCNLCVKRIEEILAKRKNIQKVYK